MKTQSSHRGATDKHKFDFQDREEPQALPGVPGSEIRRCGAEPCPCESWWLSLAFAVEISDPFVFHSCRRVVGCAQLLWYGAEFHEINLAQQIKSLVSQLNRVENTCVISREWLVLPVTKTPSGAV